MIAYNFYWVFFWRFQWKLHCGNVVVCSSYYFISELLQVCVWQFYIPVGWVFIHWWALLEQWLTGHNTNFNMFTRITFSVLHSTCAMVHSDRLKVGEERLQMWWYFQTYQFLCIVVEFFQIISCIDAHVLFISWKSGTVKSLVRAFGRLFWNLNLSLYIYYNMNIVICLQS